MNPVSFLYILSFLFAREPEWNDVRLTRVRTRPEFRPYGNQPLENLRVMEGEIEKETVWFVDLDGDDAPDAWTRVPLLFLFPVEDRILLGLNEIEMRFTDEPWKAQYRVHPLEGSARALGFLAEINEHRMRNGLSPARLDPELSDGCEKHARYADKHGSGHAQDPGHADYTREGDEAAKNSCIAGRPLDQAVDRCFRSLYHRLPLFDPRTLRYGIGVGGKTVVLDGMRGRENVKFEWPLLLPAPGSIGHPVAFAKENPLPHPEFAKRRGFRLGCPITVTFKATPFGGTPVKEVKASLHHGDADGPRVKVLVSSPEDPANEERPDNENTICILPERPLRPRSTYVARVSYVRSGKPVELVWEFKTARK